MLLQTFNEGNLFRPATGNLLSTYSVLHEMVEAARKENAAIRLTLPRAWRQLLVTLRIIITLSKNTLRQA